MIAKLVIVDNLKGQNKMQIFMDKREFFKKLMSLCLLPLIPMSLLLSGRKKSAVQEFQRSLAPRIIKDTLDMKLPSSFVPGGVIEVDGDKLMAEEKIWMAKVFG